MNLSFQKNFSFQTEFTLLLSININPTIYLPCWSTFNTLQQTSILFQMAFILLDVLIY